MVREQGHFKMDWLERLLSLTDWVDDRTGWRKLLLEGLLWVLDELLLWVLEPLLIVLGGLVGGMGLGLQRLRLELKWIQIKALLTLKTKSKAEDWTKSLGWFIPRKYWHVMGDIVEDCDEMRDAGCTERRIKFHVVYQWLIAVITLVPTAVKTSIIDAVKQVISPPK